MMPIGIQLNIYNIKPNKFANVNLFIFLSIINPHITISKFPNRYKFRVNALIGFVHSSQQAKLKPLIFDIAASIPIIRKNA